MIRPIRPSLAFALAVAPFLPACDGSSAGGLEGPLDETVVEELAMGALEAADQEGAPLPSLERLLRETYQTIRGAPGAYSEGLELLRRARFQARKAAEALEAGDEEAAKAHTTRSQALTLEAIIAVLGEEVPAQALAGVDQALIRLEAGLEGKSIPDRYRNALDRIHTLSERGHVALDAGNGRAALNTALVAADLLRAIVPRYHAEKAIRRADRAFRAAYDLVVADPTDEERDALRKARGLLNEAKDAFRAREFQLASLLARESASLSLGVIEGRSVG